MTDRDRLTLEEPEKMCEYCCNFDREHIGMDCTALCKLTMTLAYAEDYGGNCMFYNVPKNQIIVPPCNVGDSIFRVGNGEIWEWLIEHIEIYGDEIGFVDDGENYFTPDKIGKTVFLTKEEAEKALAERNKLNENSSI